MGLLEAPINRSDSRCSSVMMLAIKYEKETGMELFISRDLSGTSFQNDANSYSLIPSLSNPHLSSRQAPLGMYVSGIVIWYLLHVDEARWGHGGESHFTVDE